MSFASLCAFNYAYLVSFLSKCHAKNRQEVLAVRTSYSEEVLAVSRTQAQATLNQPQEELLLANAKKVSCIIFGLYCIHERGGVDGHCRYPARSFIFNPFIVKQTNSSATDPYPVRHLWGPLLSLFMVTYEYYRMSSHVLLLVCCWLDIFAVF